MRCVAGAMLWIAVGTASTIADEPPGHVGSEVCAPCHASEAEAWRSSMHHLAWQEPDSGSVLGDFNDSSFAHRGVTTRFVRRDGIHAVETPAADGTVQSFPVAGVAGVAPLQQYLLETEPGRLQALDIAWDVDARRWYHLYPDADLPPGDGLHWTGPYKNWNARCAECHATGFDKGYDPLSNTYRSSHEEIGVGCEACHGPGAAHVSWADAGADGDPVPMPADLSAGAEAEIQQCAGCHARREPLSDRSPVPGTPFHDAYRLALLREGLYHADGSIRDEVYVYGSFLQSKMYAKGVRCSDCHDPHRAALRSDVGSTCLQCHSPEGNPRFPSLTQALYDDPAHHFHDPGSDAARCVTCHMPETVYMGVDPRRDHAFRVPRPDLSEETGAPDPCTACHADRGAAWAAREIAVRFPEGRWREPHFSQVFAAARQDPGSRADDLLTLAESADLAGIVRASALDLLLGTASAEDARRAAALISDPDPLVRAAAVGLQRALPPEERARSLAPALSDDTRSVRIAAAREMLDARSIPPDLAPRLAAAMGEWQASLLAKADFPETQLAIGGSALVVRNLRAAEQAFRKAVEFDPQRSEAWAMIAQLRVALGDVAGAWEALDDAIEADPSNEQIRTLRAEMAARYGR